MAGMRMATGGNFEAKQANASMNFLRLSLKPESR
jgi:hypothetical protein